MGGQNASPNQEKLEPEKHPTEEGIQQLQVD